MFNHIMGLSRCRTGAFLLNFMMFLVAQSSIFTKASETLLHVFSLTSSRLVTSPDAWSSSVPIVVADKTVSSAGPWVSLEVLHWLPLDAMP